jgi:hypothetical protein
LMHWSVPTHAAPHLPQLSLSVARLSHAPEQQPLPTGHASPHVPQLAASCSKTVHTGAVAPVKLVAGQLYNVAGDHLSGAGCEAKMAACVEGMPHPMGEGLQARGSVAHHTRRPTARPS